MPAQPLRSWMEPGVCLELRAQRLPQPVLADDALDHGVKDGSQPWTFAGIELAGPRGTHMREGPQGPSTGDSRLAGHHV